MRGGQLLPVPIETGPSDGSHSVLSGLQSVEQGVMGATAAVNRQGSSGGSGGAAQK